ncbi:hypothetical protein V6615_03430 [Oscillospiraceae bacterium PP1C4]
MLLPFAPIWINEFIIKITAVLAFLAYSTFFIVPLYLLSMLVSSIRKHEISVFFKNRCNLLPLACILVSWAFLFTFHAPQPLISDSHYFSRVDVKIHRGIADPESFELTDPAQTQQIKDILSGYECRRNAFASGDINFKIEDENQLTPIWFDITVFDFAATDNTLVHFLVQDGYTVRYNSSNTDFMYEVDDPDATLFRQISDLLFHI